MDTSTNPVSPAPSTTKLGSTAERVAEAALALARANSAERVLDLVAAHARALVPAAVAADVVVGPRAERDDERVAGVAVRSVVAAPIGESGARGLLRVGATAERAFSPEDSHLVAQLAALATTTLDRVELAAQAHAAEHRLAELLEIVGDGFSVIDPSWRITYINEAGAQVLGLTPPQVTGRNVWQIVPGLVGTAVQALYEQAMNERCPVSLDDFYYAPLGRWFNSRIYPSALGLVVHSQDITERKQREAQQAAHAALRADVSSVLASPKSLDEMVQACCELAVRHLGVAFARIWLLNAPERMLELRASAGLYTHIDGGHARVPVGKFKIGLIAEEKEPHLTNDVLHDPRVGDPAWATQQGMVSFAGYPLLVDDEVIGVFAMFGRAPLAAETLYVLGAVSDALAQGIKRKQAEAALEDRARELQRSNNDLEQFAYVASHDLQEPLRMVSNYLQLIERRYKDKLDQSGVEFIGFAVEGAQRMQRLINDLLSYSRVGRRGAAFGEVELDDAFARVQSSLRATIEENGARVTADPLPKVWGDATQLEQLLQNLIGNAIKFHGAEPPRVHLSVSRVGGSWRFAVADNGIGIEPQYFERIFVIFQRLHGRHEYPGTGIGLAICKKIVDRHGGRVWVESQPGAGATFYFTLPGYERLA